ncbi:MAG: NAD(P)/FAD-dependent oxidoreductase [Acidimicrobiales bacterium]
MHRAVVIGASVAGVHAADALRSCGFNGSVTLIGAETRLPYDRPPLSKGALRDGPWDSEDYSELRPEEWYGAHDIDLRLGTRAVRLDPSRRVVILADGMEVAYDGLILATGSRARRLTGTRVSGADLHVLRTADDCAALHDRLVRHPGRGGSSGHLVVIGAGFIGLEVAATARQMGWDVAVVETAPVPLARVLGDEVGAWFSSLHRANGVDIHCATAVTGIESAGAEAMVHLRDGAVLQADLVVAGVGSLPAVDWLAGSGLQVTDGVICDEYLRTSVPAVVAAGDIARWYNPLFDESLRIEQWTNAVEHGQYAARSLLGLADGPYADVPYFWSDQFSAKMRFVGRANAAERVRVQRSDDKSLVVLFGRDGVTSGALCINATRELVTYRRAIADRVAWGDVVAA